MGLFTMLREMANVQKANPNHYPAGAPGGKGGQFAPKQESPGIAFKNDVSRIRNPFDASERVIGDYAAVHLIDRGNGTVYIATLRTFERGKGHGSKALRHITDMADKHGITLSLVSSPYGKYKGALPQQALNEFYERHGFQRDPTAKHERNAPHMTRAPQGAKRPLKLGAKTITIDLVGKRNEVKDAKGRWAPKGMFSEEEIAQGIDAVDVAPKVTEEWAVEGMLPEDRNDQRKVPFAFNYDTASLFFDRVPSGEAYAARLKELRDSKQIRRVNLADLQATQPGISARVVENYINEGTRPGETVNSENGYLADYPVVVKWNGKLFLADGHHRAAAHKFAGRKTIEVWLYGDIS